MIIPNFFDMTQREGSVQYLGVGFRDSDVDNRIVDVVVQKNIFLKSASGASVSSSIQEHAQYLRSISLGQIVKYDSAAQGPAMKDDSDSGFFFNLFVDSQTQFFQ